MKAHLWKGILCSNLELHMAGNTALQVSTLHPQSGSRAEQEIGLS